MMETSRRRRLPWLDRAGFLIGAALIGPYAIWVFVMEREMFSRLPLVLVTGLFVLALQAYYSGARDWLLRRKSRRVRIVFALLVLGLGLMSLLVVPSVLLCIVLCELSYRFTPMRPRFERFQGRRSQLALTALVILVLFPAMNAQYGIHGALRRLSPLVLMENPFYDINADGFRGPRLRRDKPPGVVRLLFLGDSSTFGWPYRYRDTYPALVGERLRERGLGRVEVINAGIPGQSLVQIRNKLERQLAYQPDAVFLMDGIHFDKSLDHFEDARRYAGAYDDHAFRLRFYPPTLVEMAVLGVVTHPFLTMRRKRDAAQVLAARAASNKRIAAAQFSALSGLLRARGIPLILLEYPSRQVPQMAREQERDATGRDGVSWIPLLHLFPDKNSYSFHDGIHPDKAGHRRIAEAIVDDLIARGWPPGGRSKRTQYP